MPLPPLGSQAYQSHIRKKNNLIIAKYCSSFNNSLYFLLYIYTYQKKGVLEALK